MTRTRSPEVQHMMGFESHVSVYDHTLGNAPHPVPNCEAKPQWAHLVLGWGTTRESCGVVRVLFVFLILIMMIDCTVRVLRMRTLRIAFVVYIRTSTRICTPPLVYWCRLVTPHTHTYPHDRVMDARPLARSYWY